MKTSFRKDKDHISLSLSESHSSMCVQWSKIYRSIGMELSLDVRHRGGVVEFIMKSREEYDKLLDDSPDIPAITIQAFLAQFPCNGLSCSRRAVSRWLNAFKNTLSIRRKSSEMERTDSV